MVPFADQINHENVDVNYDCLDPKTGISLTTEEEKEEKRRKEAMEAHNKQKEFLVKLKDDLTGISDMIEQEQKQQLEAPNESNTWRIQTTKYKNSQLALTNKEFEEDKIGGNGTKNGEEVDKDMIDLKTNKIKEDLEEKRRQKERDKQL